METDSLKFVLHHGGEKRVCLEEVLGEDRGMCKPTLFRRDIFETKI